MPLWVVCCVLRGMCVCVCVCVRVCLLPPSLPLSLSLSLSLPLSLSPHVLREASSDIFSTSKQQTIDLTAAIQLLIPSISRLGMAVMWRLPVASIGGTSVHNAIDSTSLISNSMELFICRSPHVLITNNHMF